MKIKVGDKIFDGKDQPIMVILTQGDKDNISAMPAETTKYCEFPEDTWPEERVRSWMKEDGTEKVSHMTDEDEKEGRIRSQTGYGD